MRHIWPMEYKITPAPQLPADIYSFIAGIKKELPELGPGEIHWFRHIHDGREFLLTGVGMGYGELQVEECHLIPE